MIDRIWIVLIGMVVAFVIAMLFEESRDAIISAWEYFIGFEWFDDVKDFFSSMFENLGEFSPYGLVFGILTVGMLFLLSKWTLEPFLQYYTPAGRIIWGTITYIGTFVAGYFMGKFYENT